MVTVYRKHSPRHHSSTLKIDLYTDSRMTPIPSRTTPVPSIWRWLIWRSIDLARNEQTDHATPAADHMLYHPPGPTPLQPPDAQCFSANPTFHWLDKAWTQPTVQSRKPIHGLGRPASRRRQLGNPPLHVRHGSKLQLQLLLLTNQHVSTHTPQRTPQGKQLTPRAPTSSRHPTP